MSRSSRRALSFVLLAFLVFFAFAAACGAPAREVAPPASPSKEASRARDTDPTSALALVPHPQTVARCAGAFAVDPRTRITIEADNARPAAEHLARWLGLPPASAVVLSRAPEETNVIALFLMREEGRDPSVNVPASGEEEAYELAVSPSGIRVSARGEAGLFYGVQELAKLARGRRLSGDAASEGPSSPQALSPIPCVTIRDWPAFTYRAMHLDVARHFFAKETVKRYIDLLAFYRFDVFHWHLTDDQAFRLEIDGHPELAAASATDGSYTREDVREIVAYAKDRFVTVVPEIEMPGHARAILAAHPELSCSGKKQPAPKAGGIFEDVLCAGNDKTYALLEEILTDVAKSFPSKLIHVGGDEVPTKRWAACAKCQRAMREAKVGPKELEGIFVRNVAAMVARLGRQSVVWDEPEIAARLPRGQLVVAWRGEERGIEAARAGADVVMAPQDSVYFNFWQSRSRAEPGQEGYLPWTKVLAFRPIPEALEPSYRAAIVGGEGALWTEHVADEEELDTLLMPRLAALSEALWNAGPRREPADFSARFREQRPLLDASNVRYFIEPPVGLPLWKKVFMTGEEPVIVKPPVLFEDGVVRVTTDGSEPTASSPAYAPFAVRATTTVAAALFLPNSRRSPTIRGVFEAQSPRPARPLGAVREGVSYRYYEGDFHRLPDFRRLSPKASGATKAIELAAAFRPERFAVVYEGFVRAPETGVFRIFARADDGVRVEVDGEKVVEDDGEHEAREAVGEVALATGYHAIRVAYFQGAEGKELAVEVEGPGLPRGALVVVR